MTALVVLSAAAIAAVAVAGVIRPLGRRAAAVEPADPLDDERASLVQALNDLDRDHEIGAIPDEDYRSLRTETEIRTVAVLRAIEGRDGQGTLADELREVRRPTGEPGKPRRLLWALGGVALVAVIVVLATGAIRSRTTDQTITGVQQADPLAFFEQRVKDHPNDVAARLDLADRYLAAENVKGAIAQYLSALKLDPDNPEARATLGFLLYKAGEAQDGLDQVNRALQTSPNDPESLYFKGVILLDGLHQPAEAVQAFQAYLQAAPFGARRAEVQDLLAQAQKAAG